MIESSGEEENLYPNVKNICHPCGQKMSVYSNNQSLFLITNNNTLSVYNGITCKCILSINICSLTNCVGSIKKPITNTRLAKRNSIPEQTQEENKEILAIGINPHSPIIIIGLSNCVRIYKVLYNELLLLKQLSITNCREISYNSTGAFFYVTNFGKQGIKAHVYSTIEYDLLEIILVTKQLVGKGIFWSYFGNKLYILHEKSYIYMQVTYQFKDRNEEEFEFSEKTIKAENASSVFESQK